jgi:hypothetical protein
MREGKGINKWPELPANEKRGTGSGSQALVAHLYSECQMIISAYFALLGKAALFSHATRLCLGFSNVFI